MADLKISAATLNPSPAETDNFATDKAGADFRTTLGQILDEGGGGGGLLTAEYRFDTSIVAADPGAGKFRYDNATPASVTQIFIDDLTNNGVDISNLLALITTGDRLYFQTRNDSAEFIVFNVTAPITDNTGWFTIAGTVEASGDLHANNARCLVALQIGGAHQSVPDPLLLGDGSAVAPTYSFASDPDSGMWLSGVNEVSLSAFNGRGTIVADGVQNTTEFRGARLVASNANGPGTVNFNPTEAIPVFLPRRSDGDTGLGCPAGTTDIVILTAGGIEGIRYTELNSGIIQSVNADINITAFATGGQGNLVLNKGYNVISVVATTGDSVTLPAVFNLHSVFHIQNDGANAMDVFPNTGDDLGEGTNIAVSVAAGSAIVFFATVTDTTWTQLGFGAGGGGGDVTKVGTPVDDQIGVWTGDGTLEGDAALTWNGATIGIEGSILLGALGTILLRETIADTFVLRHGASDRWSFNNTIFQSSASDGGGVLHTGASGTVPTLIPQSGDLNTGIGSAANDQINIIAGGVEAIRIAESGGAIVEMRMFHDVESNAATGFLCINENASATNPTLAPNKADEDTGIGQNAEDQLSLIAGAVEVARLQEVAGDVQFILPTQNTPLLPTLAFGDGDTGFYESSDDILRVTVGGSRIFDFVTTTGGRFISQIAGGPALLNEVASSINPTICPTNGDPNTGLGWGGDDRLVLVAGAVAGIEVVETGAAISVINFFGPGVFSGDFRVTDAAGPQIRNEAATATNPTFTPNRTDDDTGLGWQAADSLSLIAGGIEGIRMTEAASIITLLFGNDENTSHQFTGDLNMSQASGPSLRDEPAAFDNPTLVPNRADLDTGIGSAQVDSLSLITGGIQGLRLSENNSGVIQSVDADIAITAFAGGGQGNLVLTKSFNVMSVVATTGDAVTLPAGFQVNALIKIKNDGANAADIFPASGDDLGAGTDTAVSLASGVAIEFIATVASSTWTSF